MLGWMLAAVLALPAPAPEGDASPRADAAVHAALALPPELRAALARDVLDGPKSPLRRLERLTRFIFDDASMGMVYADGATHTVAESWATRRGNCLAFTLLFLALAREAGLDAWPQQVDEVLSWRRDGTLIYRNNHVNAGVRVGSRTYTIDVAGDTVIARNPPTRIDERRLLAHYYNNLAVQRQADGDGAAALALLEQALVLDPGNADLWNNAGVFQLRRGDHAASNRAYARALQLQPANSSALFNLAGLARRDGDAERAAELQRRLARIQRHDPFHQFLQAVDFERAGELPQAIDHYERAIRLHRGDHRFHAALAGAYLRHGDATRAGKALARASALSDGATRASYQARIDALR